MQKNLPEGYHRNALLVRDDGTRHRLIHMILDDDKQLADDGLPDGDAWLIYMDSEQASPYYRTAAKVRAEFKPYSTSPPADGASAAADQPLQALSKRASKARIEQARRAMAWIEPLIDNPGMFEPSTRNRLLQERAKEPDCCTPKTLLKIWRRFLQGGQTEDALLGHLDLSGRPGTVGTSGRGSKTADGRNAFQATEEDLAHMRWVIEEYYFDKNVRRTLTDALGHLHRTKYTYVDGNGKKCLKPQTECPTYRQLELFLKKNYTLEVRETSRKGEKRFALEDRSTEGSIQLECHGAGHIYEFDATIVDVLLVAEKNRANIIGKPTLYLIIDRHSRLIVGFYLGFENASYSPAMLAILSIGADKEKLCRELGIPYDKNDWPAHGIVPEKFLADQGELVKKEARRIARALRSTISNVTGERPDWKPLVECGFAMLHQIIRPDTPAYVADSEQKKRRGVNRDRDACLSLKEFTKIIVEAIIAHNSKPQDGYPLTMAQVDDQVRPIPRELWVHSVRRRMGLLDTMDFEKLREELTPRGKATITEDGIKFDGIELYYSCPEAKRLGWLVEGRRKRKPIEIAFDFRLVDNIIVYNPNGNGESFVASLTGDSVEFAGASFAQVIKHFVDLKRLTAPSAEIKRQVIFQFKLRTEPTIEFAIAEAAKVIQGASRSSRRAATAPARQIELTIERQTTPLIPAPVKAASAPQAVATPPVPANSSVETPVAPAPAAKVVPLKQTKSPKPSDSPSHSPAPPPSSGQATPPAALPGEPAQPSPANSPPGTSARILELAAAARARMLT